ncbi:MAG: hypothetical protein AB9903_34275 [Vulcanimicrobiota bacterium]
MLVMNDGGEILPLEENSVVDIMKFIVHDFTSSGGLETMNKMKEENPKWKKDWGPHADELEESIMNFIGEKRSKKMANDEIIFYIFWRTYHYLSTMVQAMTDCPHCGKSSYPLDNTNDDDVVTEETIAKLMEAGSMKPLYKKPGDYIDSIVTDLSQEMISDEYGRLAFITTDHWMAYTETMRDENLERSTEKHVRERLKNGISEKLIWFDLWMIIRNSFDYQDTLLHCCSQKPILEATFNDIEKLKESIIS